MKKLSISLLASLIALGLLATSSTNALSYTVEWTTTTVKFPKTGIDDTITINWWDSEDDTIVKSCDEKEIAISVQWYECKHTYSDGWDHTITINNPYNIGIFTIYLASAKIKNINDFYNFQTLRSIYLNDNLLEDFTQSLWNTNQLLLNNNRFETIPETIRNARWTYKIILDNDNNIFIWNHSNSDLIDLSNNPINYVWITKIDGYDSYYYESTPYTFINKTNYNFDLFGYSYNDSLIWWYSYWVMQWSDEILYKYRWIEWNNWEIAHCDINDPLKPWNYTFKVCMADSEVCDSIDFKVEYDDINIEFTQQPNSQINSINDINFSRKKIWYYPSNLISWYVYSLEKGGEIIDSSWLTQDESYNLNPNLINDDPNWTYTFEVKLLDNEWEEISSNNVTFNIAIDNTVTINSPSWPQNWNWSDKTNINFDWTTSSTLFGYYKYHITSDNSCSDSNSIITGNQSNSQHTTFNYPLWNGNYLLCIDLYNNKGNKINSTPISQSFYVVIPATISITAPNSTVTSQPIQFKWESFLPSPYKFKDYTYIVKKWDEEFSDIIENQDTKSFTLNNLRDGTYTFNITMNYDDKSVQANPITFTVNSSEWAYLNITPANWETFTWNHIKQVPINLSWNWGWSTLISDYYYELINTITSETITSGTKSKSENLSINQSLPSGTYRFEVSMLDSDEHPIINNSSTFNVVIPLDLEIRSPSAWLSTTKDIKFNRSWFSEFEHHYTYQLNKIDNWENETLITWNNNTTSNSFTLYNIFNGKYTFSVSIVDNLGQTLTKNVTFLVPDEQDLILDISDWNGSTTSLKSNTWIFTRWWKSENFSKYSYSVEWKTFKNESYSYAWTSSSTTGSFTLKNLSTWKYRFTVNMLDSKNNIITWNYKDFSVSIPASLKITSPTNWATLRSSNATFSWTGYSDIITRYEYELKSSSYNIDLNNISTTSTSFSRNDLKNWNYTLTVRISSWGILVAQDSINFTVDIPVKTSWWGWSSSKTHYNNNLKLSLWNDSPSANEWIKLVVNIDDKYTWKVSFPKLQYYSPDTEKWIDIPVTSKNYVSDYSDDAKLGYIKFSSSDDWIKDLEQFIKFSKNWYYRIYAEDKDWYDDYIEFQVSNKKVSTNTTTTTNTQNNTTVSNTPNNIDSVINQFMPEVLEQKDTSEEVYIARSCKKYTIVYSDSLNIYTSPNLNISEFFMNKAYLKRYLDSKNKYQSGCPTNIWWISTSYIDRTEDNARYTAPNGKVYFIIGQEWNYYSNELNRELKTPTSFKTIQELKYYIRDRNPLINMATLWPVN